MDSSVSRIVVHGNLGGWIRATSDEYLEMARMAIVFELDRRTNARIQNLNTIQESEHLQPVVIIPSAVEAEIEKPANENKPQEFRSADDLLATMEVIANQDRMRDSVVLNGRPVFLRITDADGFVTDERGETIAIKSLDPEGWKISKTRNNFKGAKFVTGKVPPEILAQFKDQDRLRDSQLPIPDEGEGYLDEAVGLWVRTPSGSKKLPPMKSEDWGLDTTKEFIGCRIPFFIPEDESEENLVSDSPK